MIPTTPRRRVKFKQRTPRSTRGNGRRTQRMLVAALLAVGLGAPASTLIRAAVREWQAQAKVARLPRAAAPKSEPLLRLPAAAPVAVAAPARETAARPAAGWSTPAPDAPVARSWETPFVNGRNNVAVAPVAPVFVPGVQTTAPAARDAASFAGAPALGTTVRGATAPSVPVGLQGLTAPALASLVASANRPAAAPVGGVESAPASRLAPTTGAASGLGLHPHVVLSAFNWSGVAAMGSTPDPNWTTGLNWINGTAPSPTGNSAIVYTESPTAATATNVNVDYQISSLTFQGALVAGGPDTPSYNVTGNSNGGTSDLSIGAGGITNGSANAQTLSLPVYATANQTFLVSNAAGSLNLPGATADPSQAPVALYLQGRDRTVTVDGAGTTAITGQVREGNSVVNGSLVKNGTGTLILAGDNQYSGGTTLNAGVLDFQSQTALGTGTLIINGGGVTNSSFGFGFVNNAVTVNADFAHVSGQNSIGFTGSVDLGNASRTITSTDTNENTFNFNGAISGGPGVGLNLVGSANTFGYFSFAGTAANTYSGATVVDYAELDLFKGTQGPTPVAIAGNLTVQNFGSIYTGGGQLAPATNLTVNTGGRFDATGGFITGANETFNGLNGDNTGTVTFGNQFNSTTLTVSQGTFNGLLQDGFLNEDAASPLALNAAAPAFSASPFSGTGGALNKVSTGTLTLTHNNTYSGGTLVTAGALFANNDSSIESKNFGGNSATGTGNVLVLDGARLGGSGSVGNNAYFIRGTGSVPATTTTIGGSLFVPTGDGRASGFTVTNPAILGAGATLNSTAILTVNGNLTLTSTALLETELGGTTAGTGYDQILVGGAIALGGDLSLATINGFALTVGQTFYILDGLGDPTADGALTGTFANVTPDLGNTGLYTDANGNQYRVNYADSDPNDPSETAGNDVSVTVLALSVPEPGSLALAAAGVLTGLGAWVRRRRAA